MPRIISYDRKIAKELQAFVSDPPQGMSIDADQAEQNHKMWIVNMEGAEGTLYDGEQFQLQIIFDALYPFQPPEVKFVGQNIPVHPNVYSNGHICLSILGDEWSPALTVQAVCVSIMSMLSSCKKKESPKDDDRHVLFGDKSPKHRNWIFYNDDV